MFPVINQPNRGLEDTAFWPLQKRPNSASYPGWGPDRNGLWSDHPRQKWPLIRPTQTDFSSDQTIVRSKLRVRLKCARKLPLIRLLCARMSPPDQTIMRSNTTLIRLKCVQNSLISERIWTWKNSQLCYNVFTSWKLMFSEIYSTKEKPILKVMLMKRNPKCRKKTFRVCH